MYAYVYIRVDESGESVRAPRRTAGERWNDSFYKRVQVRGYADFSVFSWRRRWRQSAAPGEFYYAAAVDDNYDANGR